MQDEKMSMANKMGGHIAACQLSGLCVKQYCKEQHLNRSHYYYWRKKLSDESKTDLGSFIQLQPVSQSSCIEIIFTTGIKIQFGNLVPADYLKQLVS